MSCPIKSVRMKRSATLGAGAAVNFEASNALLRLMTAFRTDNLDGFFLEPW
jgi:hypothetical protein